jgi:plasmid stabilization system protein ParE
MKRLKVEFSRAAAEDLDAIADFLIEIGASAATALRFVEALEEHCRGIGSAPMASRARDELGPALRSIAYRRRAVTIFRLSMRSWS